MLLAYSLPRCNCVLIVFSWPGFRSAVFLLGDNVFRLRSFLSLSDFHRDFLTFLQRLESFHLDRAVMNKHVLTAFAFDESKSFIVVEPLNGSCNSFA